MIDVTSLLFNAVLFYLIVNHSKFCIKQFKWVFMMTCVGDTLLTLVVLVGQPVGLSKLVFIGEPHCIAFST